MALLRNRPLATAAILLLLSVAAVYLLPLWTGIVLVGIALTVAFLLVFLRIRRGASQFRIFAFLLCLFVIIGSVRAILDRQINEKIFAEYIGETVEAELLVEEFSYRGIYGSEIQVKVISLNGKRVNIRAALRTSNLFAFYIGDRISGTFTCQDLDFESTYEGAERTYLGKGVRAILIASDDLLLTESGSSSFAAKRADFRASLAFRIESALPGRGGELLSALLLGTSENLSDDVVRDFRRIGVSHLLALSGLHLSLLCGGCDLLLRGIGVGKKIRLICTFLLSLLYFILTGGSVSILRAALMLFFVDISFFLRTDNDSFTALAASAAGMVLFTPTLIFNLSFVMTVLATFGILSFGGVEQTLFAKLSRHKRKDKTAIVLLRKLASSLMITLSAGIAILPVQWMIFGEISVITPLSNLLFVSMTLPLLVSAILLLVFSLIPGIVALLSYPIGIFCNLWLTVAAEFSRLNCVVSLRQNFVPFILIPLLLITFLLLAIDLKRLKPLAVTPVLAAIAAFCICLSVTYQNGRDHLDIIYRRANQNEGISLYQSGNAAIFVLSGGSYSQLNADYKNLSSCGATDLDLLVYTHYHSEMPAALSRFSKTALVRKILLPLPLNETDATVFAKLLEIAEQERIACEIFSAEVATRLTNNISFTLSEPLLEERSLEPAFSLTLDFGEERTRYESSSFREYTNSLTVTSDAEYLILGAHGPVPKQSVSLTTLSPTRAIVIGDVEVLRELTWQGEGHIILLPETYCFRLGNRE